MKHGTRAGESRPGRRHALFAVAAAVVVAGSAVSITRVDATEDDPSGGDALLTQGQRRSDAEIAADVLQRVEGLDPVICTAVDPVPTTPIRLSERSMP